MKISNSFGTRFRGKLGKQMIASSWRGIPYIREYVKPRNPRTGLQQENRGRFSEAVAAWQRLPLAEQKAYDRKAVRMTGQNLFIRRFLRGRRNGERRTRRP